MNHLGVAAPVQTLLNLSILPTLRIDDTDSQVLNASESAIMSNKKAQDVHRNKSQTESTRQNVVDYRRLDYQVSTPILEHFQF